MLPATYWRIQLEGQIEGIGCASWENFSHLKPLNSTGEKRKVEKGKIFFFAAASYS